MPIEPGGKPLDVVPWRQSRAIARLPDRQDDYKRAQRDNSYFEKKTTIHLRASNFGRGRLKDRRNLRARALTAGTER
jgi:hypothetical protein